MTLTVGDVIDLPVIRAGLPDVLSTAGAERTVRWVHVSDLGDLGHLLEGGELVLTTGEALRRDPRRYLENLARAGALGMIAEFDDSFPIPPEIGPVAVELGLTAVVLRREIKFVEVTEQVHRSLVAEQYAAVEFAHRTHETFTQLTMRRASPAEITNSVAVLLDSPVVLENLQHHAVASAGASAAWLLHDWERRSRLHASDVASNDVPGQALWTIVDVGRGDDHWARLIVPESQADQQRTAMVLERAAQALVMHRMAERGRLDIERQAQAGLVDDVLQERIRDEGEVAARAFALGLREANEYVPISVRVPGWPASDDPIATRRRTAQLLDVVVRVVGAQGHSALFSARDAGEVLVVLALTTPRGRSRQHALDALAAATRRDVERTVGHAGAVLGLGAPGRQVMSTIHTLLQASQVAEVAAGMPTSERAVFGVQDIGIRGLISLLRDDPRLQRFAESELRDLVLDDINTGGDLLDVLRGYVQHVGNKSALASHLHMSRPSLYAKLSRIEQILGVDLADGESVTSLHVALLILDGQSQGAAST